MKLKDRIQQVTHEEYTKIWEQVKDQRIQYEFDLLKAKERRIARMQSAHTSYIAVLETKQKNIDYWRSLTQRTPAQEKALATTIAELQTLEIFAITIEEVLEALEAEIRLLRRNRNILDIVQEIDFKDVDYTEEGERKDRLLAYYKRSYQMEVEENAQLRYFNTSIRHALQNEELEEIFGKSEPFFERVLSKLIELRNEGIPAKKLIDTVHQEQDSYYQEFIKNKNKPVPF